jgi:hypothetical protein
LTERPGDSKEFGALSFFHPVSKSGLGVSVDCPICRYIGTPAESGSRVGSLLLVPFPPTDKAALYPSGSGYEDVTNNMPNVGNALDSCG